MERIEATRVDAWLWAIRLFKTRSQASAACRGGHVRVNGVVAKPATSVRPGDRVEARVDRRERVLEVVRTINKRVGAPIAAECYVDHSPPPPPKDDVPVFARERGMGRPTKRERRALDRLRRR
ncbi:MAG TPA: RNA-binding S4 domain-containing protein [Acidimicrobiales bacterium]